MNHSFRQSLPWLSAGLVVVGSLWFALERGGAIRFYRGQIQNRNQELAELRRLKQDEMNRRAAFEWLKITGRPDENLAALLKQFFPGVKTDLVLRESRTAGEGWTEKRYHLRLEQVDAESLRTFLAAAENARPPVLLVDIQVNASSDNRSGVSAQLVLAELEPERKRE
jgi:hypothetical protein